MESGKRLVARLRGNLTRSLLCQQLDFHRLYANTEVSRVLRNFILHWKDGPFEDRLISVMATLERTVPATAFTVLTVTRHRRVAGCAQGLPKSSAAEQQAKMAGPGSFTQLKSRNR
jgi:hypothetical protein